MFWSKHCRSSLVIAILTVVSTPSSVSGGVDFNRDVRPILSNHCFTCHGPDAKTRASGLRLDIREEAIVVLESGGRAIVPGNPEHSDILKRVTSSDSNERMPPADGPKPLSAAQIQILRQWIEEGAEYQPHWAFVAPKRPPVPEVPEQPGMRNEIDAFVIASLAEKHLHPNKEADRETLIRRVAFDLTGLPPTPDEVDTFLQDESGAAYEHMVDRFLASPAYGEQMARHWLDLARYADTNGYQYDTERQQWVWRDWVIDAYNRNLPFDRFTVEQLAGDLLPDATAQQRLATGFHRNHGITIEGGIIDEEYRTEYVMDRVVTTGEVWMGLTIGCARCHDHKYDPVSQQEFYQLFAFFNQVPERGMRGFEPQESIPSPLALQQNTKLQAELANLKKQLERPLDLRRHILRWTQQITSESKQRGWRTLTPESFSSTGGATLTRLDDDSVLVGGANPQHDIYSITARTNLENITAVRLEALTHPSLPGGGPGRHSNSNFVLSEFELKAVSVSNPSKSRVVRFVRATADYSQKGYEVGKTIDGTVTGNNGWAVDGPTRKQPATALFVADSPFGFPDGTRLEFRLRHEAGFAAHGVGRPRLSVTADPEQQLALHGIPEQIRDIAALPEARRSKDQAKQLEEYFLANHDPRQAIKDRTAELEKELAAAFPPTMIMRDMAQLRKTFILNRGQYNEPVAEVSAGVPAIFPELPNDARNTRLGLARWLVSPRHPLTARVAVNRYWQRLFGVGLVKTSEDFGVQGELPSHPELLDWLATEFIRIGWDIRGIQKLILMSGTYRQSSQASPAAWAKDPENRLLARGPRMRLDGEEIRDAALSVSGLLVRRIGGRSVYPYQPKGLWMELNNRPGYSKEYPQGNGDDLYRRSMYTFWKRTVPSPMLKTLDAPEREFCTIRRSRTNTPLQALLLLNSPQFVEAARHLGQRMQSHHNGSLEDQLTYGFRLVTSRFPTQSELQVLVETYGEERQRFERDPDAIAKLLSVGDSDIPQDNDKVNLAAFASVARLLLNLNEAITKG